MNAAGAALRAVAKQSVTTGNASFYLEAWIIISTRRSRRSWHHACVSYSYTRWARCFDHLLGLKPYFSAICARINCLDTLSTQRHTHTHNPPRVAKRMTTCYYSHMTSLQWLIWLKCSNACQSHTHRPTIQPPSTICVITWKAPNKNPNRARSTINVLRIVLFPLQNELLAKHCVQLICHWFITTKFDHQFRYNFCGRLYATPLANEWKKKLIYCIRWIRLMQRKLAIKHYAMKFITKKSLQIENGTKKIQQFTAINRRWPGLIGFRAMNDTVNSL